MGSQLESVINYRLQFLLKVELKETRKALGNPEAACKENKYYDTQKF